MRIVFATDIHHAFKSVGDLLDSTSADLYLVCGDLVSRSFPTYKEAWHFIETAEAISIGRHKSCVQSGSNEDLLRRAESIITSNAKADIREPAECYFKSAKKAESYLINSYLRLENILSARPEKQVYVLPGNYDMDLGRTALKDRDLHKKTINVDGMRISAYGGAAVSTPGIPEHLQVSYDEDCLFDFLSSSDPHIIVLHQPAYGFLDCLSCYGNTGSNAARRYLDETRGVIVLSGHNHESWGFVSAQGSCFINPSNFGNTFDPAGARPGGYFLDMCVTSGKIDRATIRRLERKRSYAIVERQRSADGVSTLVVDEKRYARAGGKVPEIRHIAPIKELLRIKEFFLNHETPETVQLVGNLREVYRDIEKSGMEVAFDLLGSVSFGMAGTHSDLDLVVYMRSRDCVLDEEDTCGVPRPLRAVFDAFRQKGIETDVCDSIDIERVMDAIAQEEVDDGQLQRFIFYRTVCRPVNLRLIKRAENLLLSREPFRRKLEESLMDYLDILVSSVRHVQSFDKYRMRLKERGIDIPPDIEGAIKNYLRGTPSTGNGQLAEGGRQ